MLKSVTLTLNCVIFLTKSIIISGTQLPSINVKIRGDFSASVLSFNKGIGIQLKNVKFLPCNCSSDDIHCL